jgi:3-isopropylmalate dehydrogenase
MKKDRVYDIAVVRGDGIGHEVIEEALKVLAVASGMFGFKTNLTEYPHGTEYYLKTGVLFPDSVLDELRDRDAILLGAIGDPRVETGLVERAIVGGIRWKLDQYINLRPIKLYAEHLTPVKNIKPEDLDIVVVRENTEDVYTGLGGILKKGTPQEVAVQELIYTRHGVERCVRYAFELCRERNKKKRLTLVDKANAIRAQDIWTRVFAEVGEEYPEIEKDHAYVDAACMWMIKNPNWFDVIVTTNMFGDIITDLGAMVQGGMGVAASGNIHPGQVSMFEPIHGSAPKYAGMNVANPIAAIAAAQMMLDFLGEKEAAKAIEDSIERCLVTRKVSSLTAKSGMSTVEIGDAVASELKGRG